MITMASVTATIHSQRLEPVLDPDRVTGPPAPVVSTRPDAPDRGGVILAVVRHRDENDLEVLDVVAGPTGARPVCSSH
jgi:hypothetical protein